VPRVYCVNRGPHDYSAAGAFGELVYCTDGTLDKFDIAQMCRELSESLKDSEECDYILLTSLTSLCSVACAVFASKHGCLNLLIYRPDYGYVARNVVFNNRKEHNGTSSAHRGPGWSK
jgi:hypothetical protein